MQPDDVEIAPDRGACSHTSDEFYLRLNFVFEYDVFHLLSTAGIEILDTSHYDQSS